MGWIGWLSVLLLCYYSIVPCTLKGDTSDGAFGVFGGLFSLGFYELPLAVLVDIPVALVSIQCFMFTVGDLTAVDWARAIPVVFCIISVTYQLCLDSCR